MPELVNLHKLPPGVARCPEALTERWGDRWLYIDREMRHYYLPQSPLANRFHTGRRGRQGAVDLYRAWLWDAINRPVPEVLQSKRGYRLIVLVRAGTLPRQRGDRRH